MIFHPQLKVFGRLELLEVYELYDKPVLVSCRNALGLTYLAVLVEESEESEEWLYVALSEERFKQVRSGGIDLHSAYTMAEEGIAHRVTLFLTSDRVSVDSTAADTLPPEILPTPGASLNLPTLTLPRIDISLADEAARVRRPLVKLGFKLPFFSRTEAPLKFLGKVLEALQDAVIAIGQSLELPGRPPELVAVGFGGGSFEVLVAADYGPMFGQAPSSQAIEEFFRLVLTGSDADQLQERLRPLRARSAASYLAFLRALDLQRASLSAEWADPEGRGESGVKLSAIAVRAAISTLEYKTFETRDPIDVIGTLVGANLRNKTFEISAGKERGDQYSGKIHKDAINLMSGAVIGSRYTAHLERHESIHVASGAVEEQYILVGLSNPERVKPSTALPPSRVSG